MQRKKTIWGINKTIYGNNELKAMFKHLIKKKILKKRKELIGIGIYITYTYAIKMMKMIHLEMQIYFLHSYIYICKKKNWRKQTRVGKGKNQLHFIKNSKLKIAKLINDRFQLLYNSYS